MSANPRPFDDENPPVEVYGDEPVAKHRGNGQAKTSKESGPVEPLLVLPASALVGKPEPQPRDWIWRNFIPHGRVTSFLGNGGLGKTTIGIQLALHVAASRPLYGVEIAGGPVFGIFCEDEQDELDRKTLITAAREGIELETLDNLHLLSRDGEDNLLCTFVREQIVLTPFYHRVEATLERLKPRLAIFDTAADLFGGDFMSTPQVRQFLKVALGGLCVRYRCAVLLLAHPSASGMDSGEGAGFSTAWNNSVRSRIYLRRPKGNDMEEIADRRILEVKKANYGPSGSSLALIYDRGCFVPDLLPIEESKLAKGRPGGMTKFGLAIMQYMQSVAANGLAVVPFGDLFTALQKQGLLEKGHYEIVRKPLQRALKGLIAEKLLIESKVPRGYRLTTPQGDGT